MRKVVTLFLRDALRENINRFETDVKNNIKTYLVNQKARYINAVRLDNNAKDSLFSKSIWLEAMALINSSSHENAGKYISSYLANKNLDEQESYIVGLSNSNYMKKAFETEFLLKNFKTKRAHIYKQIYKQTVGSHPEQH